MFTVSVSYTDSAVNVTVRNTTAGTSGTASVTNASFVALKDVAGKVGFGGATNSSYTDLYFLMWQSEILHIQITVDGQSTMTRRDPGIRQP